MQNTKPLNLVKKRIEFEPDPQLLDWQMKWMEMKIPRTALLTDLFVFTSEIAQEVGIEVHFIVDGQKNIETMFIN